ncbi:MAG: Uma2 family endonuclease [Solirubrobacteraceae bacterium]|nr:Uma2 family endonuclease [Solirubrobacteraceae bacterium]
MALTTEPGEQLHPLTVEDYHRMVEVGILREGDPIELLEGALVEMAPEGPPHANVVAELNRFLVVGVLDQAELLVRIGSPLTFRPRSEPQPDFSIVDRAASTFTEHPVVAHLVVEVSQSSRRIDRARKARIYAQAGIPEYWIVDLVDWCVEVRTEPGESAYGVTRAFRAPEQVHCGTVALPPLDLAALFAA